MTDDPGVVERGTVEDIDAVADLWVDLARGQQAHGTHLRAEPNRTAAVDAVAHAVVSGGLLVARARSPDEPPGRGGRPSDDRGVVGFVTFGREDGRYEQDVERGTVYNLYVRPQYRGRGLGSRLLADAESVLADQGAGVVALEAMATNVDARRFYERHGYEPHRIELEKSLTGAGNDSD